jgi:phosphatidylglycerophosphatase A
MSIFLKHAYGKQGLTARQIISDPILCLAFGFGSGLLKFMPGTWGTLAALPIYGLLLLLPPWLYWFFTLLSVLTGIYICEQAAKKLGEHDFGGIVWDEVVGLLITMSVVPFSWESLAAGFVAFRFFDILKPWPISWLDKHVAGGFGIMLDDMLAGIFAAVVISIWF